MSYTDLTLAAFMETELGPSGTALFGADPSASAAIVESVNEVKAILSVDDIADLTDDLKTRTFARWQAWRAAKGAATNGFDIEAGAADLKLSQRFTHIAAMLADAEASVSRYSEAVAVIYGAGGTAYVTGVATAGSPYGYPCEGSEL